MDEDMKSNKPVPEITQEPVFEQVSEPTVGTPVYQTEVVPEEITEETPENLSSENFEPEIAVAPPPQEPPQESYLTKFLVIGGGIIFFLLIFVIILKVLSGAGGKKQAVTLEYWGLWESEEVMKPLIAEYQRKNPLVKINYSRKDPQNFREKLLTRGKEGRGPDIFRFHNTWVPSMKEILSPLPSKVMSDTEFKKTFYPVAATDLRLDKFYYGLPLEIDGLVMLYNKDLFKKSGIELAPKTWEDVIDYANRVTVKDANGQTITSGLALGTASNVENFSDILGWMLLQNGADIKKLSAPEAVETLVAYRKFAEVPDAIWDENMPNSVAAFTQGKVGMIVVPSWQIQDMNQVSYMIQLTKSPKIQILMTN
jgi:multiple sugar transport system substrate-binding protein